MPSLPPINPQRFAAVSLLIDKFMFDMGYVIPVGGFLSQDLSIIENAFNAIRDQHQTLEDLSEGYEELEDCVERVRELEEKLESFCSKEK